MVCCSRGSSRLEIDRQVARASEADSFAFWFISRSRPLYLRRSIASSCRYGRSGFGTQNTHSCRWVTLGILDRGCYTAYSGYDCGSCPDSETCLKSQNGPLEALSCCYIFRSTLFDLWDSSFSQNIFWSQSGQEVEIMGSEPCKMNFCNCQTLHPSAEILSWAFKERWHWLI